MENEFFLTNHDVCKQLGCPLENDVPYAYNHSMLISSKYPSVS
jgi:hypothetical protein